MLSVRLAGTSIYLKYDKFGNLSDLDFIFSSWSAISHYLSLANMSYEFQGSGLPFEYPKTNSNQYNSVWAIRNVIMVDFLSSFLQFKVLSLLIHGQLTCYSFKISEENWYVGQQQQNDWLIFYCFLPSTTQAILAGWSDTFDIPDVFSRYKYQPIRWII